MSSDQPNKDPRERMAELFEQRLRQRQGEQPTERPPADGAAPRRPTPGNGRSAPPPSEPPATLPPATSADGQVMQRYLQELERRLAEVGRREQELAAMEARLSQRLAEGDRGPAPPPTTPPGETAQAMQARLEDLERRLGEVSRREQQSATLEQLGAFEQQLTRRMEALGAALRPAEPPPAGANPSAPAQPAAPEDTIAAPPPAPAELGGAPAATAATLPAATRQGEGRAAADPEAAVAAASAAPARADAERRRLLLLMAVPLAALLLLGLIALAQTRLSAGHPSAAIVTTGTSPLATTAARPSPTVVGGLAAAGASTGRAAGRAATALPTAAPPSPTAAPRATATATVAPTATVAATATAAATATPALTATTAGGVQAGAATLPLRLAGSMTLGQSLCDLAADASGQHLYVTDDGPEQLLVVDPASGQATGRFNMQDSLCSIALDEAGHTVYAPTWHRTGPGQFDGSRIQAVDLASGAIRSFADDHFPTGPFFDARARRLYVGDTAQPSLAVIDAGSGATDSWPLTARVNRAAVSSRGGRLYLASPDGNRVLVVDTGTHAVLSTLSAGQRPWGVAADAGSGNVLVSSELSDSVSLIDPATDQVTRTTTVGSHPRNLAADDHGHFYVLNAGDRTVSTLDAQGTLLGTSAPLPGSEDLSGLAVAAQTGQVYVVSKTHIYALR